MGKNEKNPRPRLRIGKLSYLLCSCCCWLFIVAAGHAAPWTEAKKQAVTVYMQQYRHDWTAHDTELMAQGNLPHAEADVFVNGRPINEA